jgi:RNA polymerase sigma-70 factor (ECF subfamily)
VQDITALALAAGRGDRSALERFVRETQADVWRYCRHLVGPAHADDLTQDTFARAIRSLPSFQGRASARTWLFTIARRACADWIRGQQRRARLMTRLKAVPDEGDVRAPDGWVELEHLLDELSDDRRDAFVLTQVLGLSYDDAAAVCDCPVGTIRSRVSRARLDLLEAMEPHGNRSDAVAD